MHDIKAGEKSPAIKRAEGCEETKTEERATVDEETISLERANRLEETKTEERAN